jgi:hypothetical protein
MHTVSSVDQEGYLKTLGEAGGGSLTRPVLTERVTAGEDKHSYGQRRVAHETMHFSRPLTANDPLSSGRPAELRTPRKQDGGRLLQRPGSACLAQTRIRQAAHTRKFLPAYSPSGPEHTGQGTGGSASAASVSTNHQ